VLVLDRDPGGEGPEDRGWIEARRDRDDIRSRRLILTAEEHGHLARAVDDRPTIVVGRRLRLGSITVLLDHQPLARIGRRDTPLQ